MPISLEELQKQGQIKTLNLSDLQKMGNIKVVSQSDNTISKSQGFVSDTISNIGSVLKGVGKGVLSTGYNTGKLLETAASKITGQKTLTKSLTGKDENQINKDFITPQNTPEKIGFYGEQIGEFFIPSSAILKTSKVLEATKIATKLAEGGKLAQLGKTILTKALPLGATEGAISTAQSGDVKTGLTTGAISGAIPVVGKGLSIIKPSTGAVKSALTGVPKDVFQRIKEMPEVYDNALKHIAENEKQPFLGLANAIGNRIGNIKIEAQKKFTQAVDLTKQHFPDTVFNLNNKIPEINKTLNKFRLNIPKFSYKVGATTRTTPYTDKEIQEVQSLVNKMRTPDMSVDELLDFHESVKNFFGNAIKQDNEKMIALASALVDDSIKFTNEVFPQIKNANNLYTTYYDLMKKVGSNILDSEGNLKNTAEQYLSNVANLNKGQARDIILSIEKDLGIPVLDNIQILKDAQKLNNIFPQTGSRTQDILRSLVAKGAAGIGVAGSVINPIGAALSGGVVAVTSPLLNAKGSIMASKVGKKILKKAPQALKDVGNFITGK